MAFLFKIQIQGISKPPVWRKLSVPEHFTFNRFHNVIQAAFGWNGSHKYEFSPSGWGSSPTIGSQHEKYFGDGPDLDSETITLGEIFKEEKQKFTYIYDFGDDWNHIITLEKITDQKLLQASCIDGKGANLPEDCGGAMDYPDFLEAIRDPSHPQHDDMIEWSGLSEGQLWEDVHAFDLEATNKLVEKV